MKKIDPQAGPFYALLIAIGSLSACTSEGSDGESEVPWHGPTSTPSAALATSPETMLTASQTVETPPTTLSTPTETALDEPCAEEVPPSVIWAIPEEHACTHFEEGPVREAVAGENPELAPDISRVHTRFDISLTQEASGWSGWVQYTGLESGYYSIFSANLLPIAIYGPDLEPLCLPSVQGPKSCDDFLQQIYVSWWQTFPVYLYLGPFDTDLAQIVIEDIDTSP